MTQTECLVSQGKQSCQSALEVAVANAQLPIVLTRNSHLKETCNKGASGRTRRQVDKAILAVLRSASPADLCLAVYNCSYPSIVSYLQSVDSCSDFRQFSRSFDQADQPGPSLIADGSVQGWWEIFRRGQGENWLPDDQSARKAVNRGFGFNDDLISSNSKHRV